MTSPTCDEPLMCRGEGMSVLFLLSLQNRLWPFHPWTQILFQLPIYIIHCPCPSAMAHPMAQFPASFLPCFPQLHKTRVQLHPLTPLPHSLLTSPGIPVPCSLPPQSQSQSADPDVDGGSRAGWVTTSDRNKSPPATGLSLSAVQMIRALSKEGCLSRGQMKISM